MMIYGHTNDELNCYIRLVKRLILGTKGSTPHKINIFTALLQSCQIMAEKLIIKACCLVHPRVVPATGLH